MPPRKMPANARFCADAADWFKARGRGCQTRINAMLRRYVESHRKAGKPAAFGSGRRRMARADTENPAAQAADWAGAVVGLPPLKTPVNARFGVNGVD